MYRPKGYENPYNFVSGGAIPKYEIQSRCFDEGADAMLETLFKLAKESPLGTFTIDSREITLNGLHQTS